MTNDISLAKPVPGLQYQLKSITPAETPAGCEGTWFHYVIVLGASQIAGIRCGSEAEVNVAAADMIERLNERSAGKSSKKAKTVVKVAKAA